MAMKGDGTNQAIWVKGMTCTNCAQTVRKGLEDLGLDEVWVNHSNGKVRFNNPQNLPEKSWKTKLQAMGYPVIDRNSYAKEKKQVLLLLIISTGFTLPLFLHMFFPPWSVLYNPWLQLSLCLPVMGIGWYYFGQSAWKGLRRKTFNMDLLISLGSTAAFVYSLIGFIQHIGQLSINEYLYFETAATIITLVLLGNYLEARAIKHTGSALNQLESLREPSYPVLKEGKWVDTPIEKINVGNHIQLSQGQRVPTDGKLIQGQMELDLSALTGESWPESKQTGASIPASALIIQGNGVLEAARDANQSSLNDIVEMMEAAQSKKPKIQVMGDRVAHIFVPLVLAIAALTFCINFFLVQIELSESIMRSIAVLLIACPCAMGLATPTAIMVGLGQASKIGVWFRSGASLERLAQIHCILFDKTGTLTEGKFRLKDLKPFGHPVKEIQEIIYNLCSHSKHPISRSLAELFESNSRLLHWQQVEEMKGLGMKGIDASGNRYILGSKRFTDAFHDEKEGHLFLIKNEQIMASLKLEDKPRPHAKSLMNHLKQQGIKSMLISGDHQDACNLLANNLGIAKAEGQLLPQEKLMRIQEQQKLGPVAMVGDGINDAPALQLADVGIAIGEATDLAQQAADVLILHPEALKALPLAQAYSKSTLKCIKQNLIWALAYNVVAIPLAATGHLSPMLAALSMAFSDLVIIGNSLALKLKLKPKH